MDWLRRNAGWIAVALSIGGALASLYVRAALADTQSRITVLETQRVGDAGDIGEIKQDIREIKQDVKTLLSRENREGR